jgi:alpha-tubulin suppressor-like RCC1 family protein/Tol biopolymer transport system component
MAMQRSWRAWALLATLPFAAAEAAVTLAPVRDIVEVGLGDQSTCALDRNGRALCWGSNEFGQLGQTDGLLSDRATPVPVASAGTGLRGLAVGAFHACAITSGGGVKCWGRDLYGALGDGPEDTGPLAVDVVGLRAAPTALTAGVAHGCALFGDGSVQCWGFDTYGQLGDGTTVEERPTAVDVLDLGGRAIAIEAGDTYTCAILEGGSAKCWGDNDYGQLGDGSTTRRSRPVAVQGLPGPVRKLAAGSRATCAVSEAGAVFCWGAEYPLLAFEGGSLVARAYPGFESGYVDIDAGTFHFCALRTGNTVKCLGDGFVGQFGTGPIDGSLNSETAVGLAPGITRIHAAGRHTCALNGAGGLQCWGLNTSGQLGLDTTTRRLVPTPVVGLSTGTTAIAAGGTHSCAITTGGGVKCWGSNNQDSIGDGSNRVRLTPVDVTGLSSGVRALDAGTDHGCVIDAQRRVLCWGANYDGRLGNGTTLNSGVPVEVQGLGRPALAIAVGNSHACALLEGGGVKCWGTNAFGQLGDDSTQDRLGAVDVATLGTGVRSIAAGYNFSCAVTEAEALLCWGENTSGQLGDGSTTHRDVPTPVVGLAGGVRSVAAGDQHACAVVGAQVKCWGFNFFGLVLGDGSSVDRSVPGDVPAFPQGVERIALGAYASCAIDGRGALHCWGVNPVGDNTELGRPAPTPVAGVDAGATDVDIGFGGHLCVVQAGAARCWGSNSGGQIGDGTTDGVPTPQTVLVDELERRVAAVAPAANRDSVASQSDASGRYVVFQSSASTLVANDTNDASDIFVTDRETGLTERVSLDAAGAQIAGGSIEPSISADGSHVVFVAPDAGVGKLWRESAAQGEARRQGSLHAVFMRNLITGATQRMGSAMSGGTGTAPQIAPAATAVVFASNTGTGAAGRSNVFHVPLASSGPPTAPVLTPGPTRCVSCKSVAANGGATGTDADGESRRPVVSADGTLVAWETSAGNTLADSPSPCSGGGSAVVMRNLVSGAAQRVSPAAATPVPACSSSAPSLDYAGTTIAFVSTQPLEGSDTNGVDDIYVTGTAAGAPVVRVSQGSDGSEPNGASTAPRLAGDGRSVVFISAAQNLDLSFADNNDRSDVHAAVIGQGAPIRLSRSVTGAEAEGSSARPTINYDGTKLGFDTTSRLAGMVVGSSSVYQRSNPLVPALKSATWWKSSESGWGLTVFDQGSVLAPTWFTYDSDGEPTWFIVGGAFPQADGSYRGDLLRFTGTRYDQISGPAAISANPVGSVTLRYSGENVLAFDYTAFGTTQSKTLVRFPFGARNFSCTVDPDGDRSRTANYTDLWTGGESANAGWGLTLFHIDSGMFAIWYTYDLDGEATFFVIAASRQADDSYAGTIFRQRNGTPFLQISDQLASPASDPVGTASFRFTDGDSATFDYSLGGISQSKPIVRLRVGSRASECQAESPF